MIELLLLAFVVWWMNKAIDITIEDSKQLHIESMARVAHSETFVNEIEAYTKTNREDNDEYGG